MVKRKKPIGELVKLVDQEIHRTRCSINEAATRVADKNQVKKETLRKAYQRSRKNKSKKHGNQIFTDLTEKKLCSLILAFSTKGLALRRYLLLDFVKRTYNKGDKWNGSVWFRGFMERHAATLSYTKSKGLDIQRVHNVSKDIVDKFLTAYENVLETYKLKPDSLSMLMSHHVKFQNLTMAPSCAVLNRPLRALLIYQRVVFALYFPLSLHLVVYGWWSSFTNACLDLTGQPQQQSQFPPRQESLARVGPLIMLLQLKGL